MSDAQRNAVQLRGAMGPVEELRRLESPTPGNTSIAYDGQLIWIGSIETNRLYAIDPNTWDVREEFQLGGTVFGLVPVGDTMRVMLGEGEDSFRTIYRLERESGVTQVGAIASPDGGTGSHMGYDGERIFIGQRDLRRIVALDGSGIVGTVIDLPYRLYGVTIVRGRFYCVATDHPNGPLDEFLLRVDDRYGTPALRELASFPFDAHGIAFDGQRFWTNDRASAQVVAFANPDPDLA